MSSSVKSSSGKAFKRKKNFYKSFKTKRTKFTPFKEGVKGFLVTCNKSENHAVKEAFFLLNKYADLLADPENAERVPLATGKGDEEDQKGVDEVVVKKEETAEEPVDLESELEKEVAQLKGSRRRFNQLTTKTHNVIFIEAKEPSLEPNNLVDLMFNDIKKNAEAGVKFCLKMIPVLMTCGAHIESIKKTMSTLLEDQPEKATYYIIPRVRANTSLSREEIIKAIGEACEDKRSSWTPDFEDPEFTIVVNIINKICCLSILTNFNLFKKYNPVELTLAHEETPAIKKEGQDEPKGQVKESIEGSSAKKK